MSDGSNNSLMYVNNNSLSKVKGWREEERIEREGVKVKKRIGRRMKDNSILPNGSSCVSHAM